MFNWFKTKPIIDIKINEREIKCPYCSIELEKIPVRKSKCKSCKKIIYIRTNYLTSKKLLLSEKDATIFDIKEQKEELNDLRISNRKTLREYRKSDFITKVEILTASDSSCKHCKELNGKIIDINEALENDLLPCKECTYKINSKLATGWCRCCYAPHIE